MFAEVHPFGSVTAETITVDLVTPEEDAPVPEKPDPPESASPRTPSTFPRNPRLRMSPAPVPQPAAASAVAGTGDAAFGASRTARGRRPAADAIGISASRLRPPQPDLSIKYHVMLGLPPDLPPSLPRASSGDAFDAQASKAADIAASLVTEFRRHLRTCSKLPASIAPSDKVKVKLRVLMTPEGRLAAEPILIEASASAKGPALMQGAISALQGCQPYAMLPADRYGEWKVLDFSFTPQDFAGG